MVAALVRESIRQGRPVGEITKGTKAPAGWDFKFRHGSEFVDKGKSQDGENGVILFKENGELMAVRMNPGAHGIGTTFAKAVTDKDLVRFNGMFEWIPWVTRKMAALRTQYVPTFILRNFKADSLEVALNTIGERGVRDGLSFMGSVAKNEARVIAEVVDYFKNGNARGYMKEFAENGGLTGGGLSAQAFSETQSRIEEELKRLAKMGKASGRVSSVIKTIPEVVSLLNAVAENTTRVGVYAAMRERGASVADAVSYARDATVNFNRKGWLTPYLNAAYMFSNASIQGMGRAFKAMRSKYGWEAIAGVFLVGVLRALLFHYFGHDDDDERAGLPDAKNMTEFEKQFNIGFPLPGKTRSVWPIRNPWALPMYLGYKVTEVGLGDDDAKSALVDVLYAAGDFVTEPIGGNGFSSRNMMLQTFSPTMADPLVQWLEGKDFKDDDRLRKSFNGYAPLSWNGKDSTPFVYKWIAKGLNAASGGDEFKKGALDTAPENWQLLAESVGGGLLTDANRVLSAGTSAVDWMRGSPQPQNIRNIPVLRDSVMNQRDISGRYYDALDEYKSDLNQYKGYAGTEKGDELLRLNPLVESEKAKELSERVENLAKMEKGYEKLGKRWVEHEYSPEEKRQMHSDKLQAMADFVFLAKEGGEESYAQRRFDATVAPLVQTYHDMRAASENAELSDEERASLMERIRMNGGPLFADDSWTSYYGRIATAKKADSGLKNLEKAIRIEEKKLEQAKTDAERDAIESRVEGYHKEYDRLRKENAERKDAIVEDLRKASPR